MFSLKALFVVFKVFHYPQESPRGERVIDFLYTVFIISIILFSYSNRDNCLTKVSS